MTLIVGIGDEVIQFFILLAIAFIALVAWWSTNLSERPLIRTVFIVERQTIRRAPTDTQTIAAEVTEAADVSQEGNEIVTENKTSQPDAPAENQIEVSVVEQYENNEDMANSNLASSDVNPQDDNENARVESIQESNNSETSDETVLRNRRLAFFNAKQEQKTIPEPRTCTQNANPPEESQTPGEGERQTESSDEGNIRIRLKYLNDDQKLVEGKLQEQLGDFKRRHFSLELAGRKLVRLIFKGQVLQEDTKTLQNCGFFDNCVVHCLVQSQISPPSPNLNRPRNETQSHNDNSQHWGLGNIFFASFGLLLGLAWYGRYQYAHLYTATTTVTLVGLTGLFTVFLIGMYMPDTDGVRT